VIESSDLMTQQKTPGLGQTVLQIGDVHVRNRATIVEFLVHSDSGADHQGVVLALESIIVTQVKQWNVQLIRLVYYQASGNRYWRK
jgi:CO/xanthine dehydrogenase FAD-binding subunit